MGGADPLLSPGHPKPVLLMSILLYLWSCICPFPGHLGVHSVGLVGVSWGLPQTDTSCTQFTCCILLASSPCCHLDPGTSASRRTGHSPLLASLPRPPCEGRLLLALAAGGMNNALLTSHDASPLLGPRSGTSDPHSPQIH